MPILKPLHLAGLFAVVLIAAACSGDSDSVAPATTAVPQTTTTAMATTTTAAPQTTTSTEAREPVWAEQIEVGQCFDDVFTDDGGFDFDVAPVIVDCDQPHDNEVVAMAPLAPGEYRGDDVLGPESEEACSPFLDAFLGERRSDNVLLTPWMAFSDEQGWEAGVQSSLCIVFGEQLIGTAASGSLTAPGEKLAAVGQLDATTGVWILDTTTGAAIERYGDPELWVQRTPVGWSPDGSVIYFAQGTDDVDRVIVKTTGDGGLETVVDDVPGPGTPTIDSTGGFMAYIASPDGEFDVFIRDLSTQQTVNLTDNPGRDTSPSFSLDDDLAVRSSVDGNSDIWVTEGSSFVRLTSDPGFDGDPRWSPDGTQLLFSSDRNGNFDVWIMDADGSNQRPLTTHPANDEYPAWSSDGQFIAFQSNRHGGVSIWLMRADGSEQSSLSQEAPLGYPSFAPASQG